MYTLLAAIVGAVGTLALAIEFQTMFLLGYGSPNVIPEAGETLAGWWLMFVLSTYGGFLLAGVLADAFYLSRRFIRG